MQLNNVTIPRLLAIGMIHLQGHQFSGEVVEHIASLPAKSVSDVATHKTLEWTIQFTQQAGQFNSQHPQISVACQLLLRLAKYMDFCSQCNQNLPELRIFDSGSKDIDAGLVPTTVMCYI